MTSCRRFVCLIWWWEGGKAGSGARDLWDFLSAKIRQGEGGTQVVERYRIVEKYVELWSLFWLCRLLAPPEPTGLFTASLERP